MREASKKLEIIPATYKTVEVKVELKPASKKILEVPAVYETVTEKVIDQPARTEWKKGTGGLTTKQYKVKGPVMLMMTTTAIDIDEELMNRCLVLSVNESREQTQAIHERQRSRQTLAGVLAANDKDKITALHLTSIIVTVYSTHAAKEYKVTPATVITLNGQPSTLSSLSTGMDVTIAPASDPTVAAAISRGTEQSR